MKKRNYLIIFGVLAVFFQGPALAAEPCSRPLAPSSVQAQTGPGVGQITLYWSPVSNVDYYTITYGLASGGYIYGSPNIGGNSQYTVSGLAPGRVYYFVLTSVNSCGSSGYSEEASARAGGNLPVAVVSETKGGIGWQPSGAGQSGVVPSAQPVPLTETVIQPLAIASDSAETTVSAKPDPSPFIPPKPEPFWREWGFLSKVGIAAGVIFVILLIATSLKFKKRDVAAPPSSDVAAPPFSADKMVSRQTVEDEPERKPASTEWPPAKPNEQKDWPPPSIKEKEVSPKPVPENRRPQTI